MNPNTNQDEIKEEPMSGMFMTRHLLNYEQLKIMRDSCFPNQKAKLIGGVLVNYYFLSRGKLYVANKDMAYDRFECEKMQKDELKAVVTTLLDESVNNLVQAEREALFGAEKKAKFMCSYDGVKTYYANLEKILSLKDVKMDHGTEWQLHFQNGYIDLKTGAFKARRVGDCFITRYIKRDYVPSAETKREQIMSVVNQIYPLAEDRDVVLSQLGRALSGMSACDQMHMFLLGCGSSGKSFIMKLTGRAFECYLSSLPSGTFELNNSKVDKTMNTFDTNPVVRIAWINEMTAVKLDDSLFKQFCEGSVNATKLYQDGAFDIPLHCKTFFTSNKMPNIAIDSGSSRRIMAYEHMSAFVDNVEDVDESKYMFQKDKQLETRLFSDDEILNAWTDILTEHCMMWKNGKAPALSEGFTEAKDLITSSNDVYQDFIDKMLELTQNPDDRIGKEKMRKLFSQMYPDKHPTVQSVITGLKQKRITYSPNMRADYVQGCFVGVKAREINERCMFDTDELDHGTENSKAGQINELMAKIAQLEAENAELKRQLAEKPPTQSRQNQINQFLQELEDEAAENKKQMADVLEIKKGFDACCEKKTEQDDDADEPFKTVQSTRHVLTKAAVKEETEEKTNKTEFKGTPHMTYYLDKKREVFDGSGSDAEGDDGEDDAASIAARNADMRKFFK